MRKKKKVKSYPILHQYGYVSFEQSIHQGMIKGDLGIQVADDGRIWICLNGQALIRFSPHVMPGNGKERL